MSGRTITPGHTPLISETAGSTAVPFRLPLRPHGNRSANTNHSRRQGALLARRPRAAPASPDLEVAPPAQPGRAAGASSGAGILAGHPSG